jgi:hypothetical protein
VHEGDCVNELCGTELIITLETLRLTQPMSHQLRKDKKGEAVPVTARGGP